MNDFGWDNRFKNKQKHISLLKVKLVPDKKYKPTSRSAFFLFRCCFVGSPSIFFIDSEIYKTIPIQFPRWGLGRGGGGGGSEFFFPRR